MLRASQITYIVDGVHQPTTVYNIIQDAAGNITVNTYNGTFIFNSMDEKWVFSPYTMPGRSFPEIDEPMLTRLEQLRAEMPNFPYTEEQQRAVNE